MSPIPKLTPTARPDDTDVNIPEIFNQFVQFVSLAYQKIGMYCMQFHVGALIMFPVVGHPYIFGFILIMWSYHPKAPFQAITFVIWTLPKKMFIGLLRCVGFGEEGVQPGNTLFRTPSLPVLGLQSYLPKIRQLCVEVPSPTLRRLYS